MSFSDVFYYAEANIACTAILGVILLKIGKDVDRQTSTIVIRYMIRVMMCYFLSDSFWALCVGHVIPVSHQGTYVATIVPYAFLVGCGYCWFYYGETIQQNEFLATRTGIIVSIIPMTIAMLVIVIGTFEGIVFSFDDKGHLQYGPLYLLLLLAPIGYMSYSSVKAFIKAYTQNRYLDHSLYFVIGIFPIIPIVCGVLQAIFLTVPIMCYGATLAVLLVYITSLENLISMDSLTKVNNRLQFQRYITKKMKTPTMGKELFLMIFDVDHFKEINDYNGHVEGDRALIRVATAMKESCKSYRNQTFIARYGGDEFVIVAEMNSIEETEDLALEICSNVIRANKEAGVQYNLSVCVGIAKYDYSNPVTIPKFLAEADKGLYEMKEKR